MTLHSPAHRAGHLGDVLECTPAEYRELESLRRQVAAIRLLCDEADKEADIAAVDFEGYRPTAVVPVLLLRKVWES